MAASAPFVPRWVTGRPKPLRPATILLVGIVLAAVLALLFFPSEVQAADYSAQEIEFIRLLNEYRVDLGLEPLMVSDVASNVAKKHSLDMGAYGFFSHTSLASDYFPTGSNGGRRLLFAGYPSYLGWGENIAAGLSTAAGVVSAWKSSPEHDRMMTFPGFKVMGIGMVYVPGSPYGYYWTVDFGSGVDASAYQPDDLTPSTTSTTVLPPGTSTTSTPAPTPSTTSTTSTASTTTTTNTTTTTLSSPPPTTTTVLPTTTTIPGATTTTIPGAPGGSGSGTTPTTIPGKPVFADVPAAHRFYASIMYLATAGVVGGTADGMFHPDAYVTRAQFAKIIVLALGAHSVEIDNIDRPTFSDVVYSGDPYPFDFVEEAAGLGIIRGFWDGTFAPRANVTRLQLALMLVRAGGDELAAPPAGFVCPFTDVPGSGRAEVATAFYNGLLSGKTTTRFEPYGYATRGQVARMVHGLMQVLTPTLKQ